MIGNERWKDNWRVVSPAGAVRVNVPRSPAKRRASRRVVSDLLAGTPVVLVASAPRAIDRCRTFATEAGIELQREYLAFPTAEAPAYLVEDAPAPVRHFVSSILAAPARGAFSVLIDAGLRLLRGLGPLWLIRALAPGRVAVGRRA